MASRLSRRGFMGCAAASVLALGCSQDLPGPGKRSSVSSGGAFRFVHLTDLHIRPEHNAAEGVVACLKAVNKLGPKPDFILTGGDLVMDVCESDFERATLLFDVLVKTFRDYASIPVRHCIGNHDIFGWSSRRKVPTDHPQYGKKMFCDRLNLPRTYYTFDHKGWQFFVLDNIQPFADSSYQGCIDEEQMAWLLQELTRKQVGVPAVVVCHIPILSSTVFVDLPAGDSFNIPVSMMCRDSRKLADLFAKHNVRLVLSGHTHEVDVVDYRGVKFICGGSVCGAWWTGPQNGFKEGFGVLDMSTDGSLKYCYRDYGWIV